MAAACGIDVEYARMSLLWLACLALACIAPSSRAEPLPTSQGPSPDVSVADAANRGQPGPQATRSGAAIHPVRPAAGSFAPAGMITSPCVLHTAQVEVRRRERGGPGGQPVRSIESARCSIDAECVEEQGKATQGDGLVSLACKQRACRCSIERLGTKVSRGQKRSFRFSIDHLCSEAETAKTLLIERCMPGMQLVED